MVYYLEGKKFVQWLRKMASYPSIKDNSRYCAFHREVGHTIEKGRSLKNEVLKLIKIDYLKELMSQLEQKRNQGQLDQNGKSCRPFKSN